MSYITGVLDKDNRVRATAIKYVHECSLQLDMPSASLVIY